MKYCPTQECRQTRYFSNDEEWCSICREELTPCIQCLCGEEEINPRCKWEAKACPKCGERFTDEYLGRCMSAQLKGMLAEITARS